ncbi:VPS10 domain-containing receptor SorCS1-like [Saccostrea echinata]|uniref:VPS10 domain-containing receptor SorCS1-like n=1 Tax=Saccostrea echinata TaxID=191078 RepID=UPI002A82668E|nr:VPS10 domain-containing receptor SorCS1-like [Saccostrea echinata]
MDDVNTAAISVWVHVLLILLVHPSQGKFYRWGNGDKSVVKLDFKNVDPQNDNFLRFKRETSSGSNITTDSSMGHRVISNKFIIPDKNHTQAVVHWSGEGSDVLFVLTREQRGYSVVDSTFWRSADYGKTFQKIGFDSDAVLEMIYKSTNASGNKKMIVTDCINKRLYLSSDEGLTWRRVDLPFSPYTLLLHPSEPSWLLGYSLFDMQLFVSSNFGSDWTLLQEHVMQNFFWAVDKEDQNKFTVHMEITDYLAFSEYKACIAPACTDVTTDKSLGTIDPFSLSVQKEYIFVKKTKAGEHNPELYVSYKRGPFRKAHFPLNVHPRDFLIVDANQNQVFVAADHEENLVTLYLSEPSGQFFVPTLENIVSDQDGWFQMEIDLYEVKGIPGTYISNQYVVPDPTGSQVSERTFITFDKGGNWRLLEPPAELKSGCKNPQACSLNLHQTYSKNKFDIPSIVSKPEAPGLILAHGRVGDSLYNGVQARVFTSRDGGLSWKQAPFVGYYHLNILDQGGVITAILQDNKTNIVYYSIDEGSTWYSHEFADDKMIVDGVLNEPGINTLMVSVYGRLNEEGDRQMVQLNFTDVLPKKCSDFDYENWTVFERGCILGRKMVYHRRKADAKCFNGRDYERPTKSSTCLCSDKDYECDYGYELTDTVNKICTRASWFDESLIKVSCKGGQAYNKSQGYRKVAADHCVGGVENSDKYRPIVAMCPILAPSGLQLSAAKSVFPTGEKIAFTLSQAKGSEVVTNYTWDFGDGQVITLTGLANSTDNTHTYTKAGKYNVSVTATNSGGQASCYITISIEDVLKAVYLELPWGAQLGRKTHLRASLFKEDFKNFGQVHFVWKFGDKYKEEPYLTWTSSASHIYNKTGKYTVSVEAVNSVGAVKREMTIDVYDQLATVELELTASFQGVNRGTFLSRSAASDLLSIELSKILHIPSSRLIITIPSDPKRNMVDVTILPPDTRGLSIQQVISALRDKVQSQEVIFSLLTDAENIIAGVSVKVVHAHDIPLSTPSPRPFNVVTPTSSSQHRETASSLSSNIPVIVGVSVTITVFIIIGISIILYRRRNKVKKDHRYSLIMNRSQLTHTDEEDDFMDEDDFIEGIDDYIDGEDNTDGSTNIVINTGRHPTLVMMTGGRPNNSPDNASIC